MTGPGVAPGYRFKRLVTAMAIVGISLCQPQATRAAPDDGYPNRTVRILVGFPAGSGPDGSLRILATRLAEKLGKPVIVENVTGTGGNLACERTAKSQPDGHTLVLCTNGALAVSPSLYEKMAFDPQKDLLPITPVSSADNILVVPPSLGVKSVAELVALAKSKPGELMFGHGGVGSTQHLGAELFRAMAKIDIRPVSYRGATAVMPDLLTGRIHLFFGNIANALPLVKQGQLVALATAGAKRGVSTPDIPTMAELGYANFNVVPWYGLMAPAGTPLPIVRKIEQAAREILADREVRAQFLTFGFEVENGTRDSFAQAIQSETVYWSRFLKDAGIRIAE